MKKRIIIAAAITLALTLTAGIILLVVSMNRSISYDMVLRGDVSSEVRVERGKNGIPVIHSNDMKSAYLAMGFLHAQDRLLLIEYFRALALGRLAELIGPEGLEMDKITRLLAFEKNASDLFKELDTPSRENLTAYIKGINLYRHKGAREIIHLYNILDEDWTEKDTLALLLLFEWSDYFFANKRQVFIIPSDSYSKLLEDLLPEDMISVYRNSDKNNIRLIKHIKATVKKFLVPSREGFAFHIPGENTKNGQYMSGLGMDSSLMLFPLAYPAVIIIPKQTLHAFTLAGQPFIFAGKTAALTFAGFNLSCDVQDYVLEKTRTEKGKFQYYRGSWKDVKQEKLTFWTRKSRTPGDETGITVRRADSSPVISDVAGNKFKTDVISLQYLTPGKGYVRTLFNLPLADTIRGAQKLLKDLPANPKSYLLGSKEGAIRTFAGQLPLRKIRGELFKKGETLPAKTRTTDLSQYFSLARRENTIAGSQINENIPAPLREYLFFNDINRYYRLKELLEREKSIERDYVRSLLLDRHSVIAEKYAPVFHTLLNKIPITSARLSRIYLYHWDFKAQRDLQAPTIMHATLIKMLEETISDELKSDKEEILENHYLLLDKFYNMIIGDKSLLFDDILTRDKFENRDTIFDRGFLKAMKSLNRQNGPIMENWTWGNTHRGFFQLPVNRARSFLAGIVYKGEDQAIEGDGSTISAGSVDALRNLRCGKVTSLRCFFDADNDEISLISGISSHPLSKYYKNFETKPSFTPFGPSKVEHISRIVPDK